MPEIFQHLMFIKVEDLDSTCYKKAISCLKNSICNGFRTLAFALSPFANYP